MVKKGTVQDQRRFVLFKYTNRNGRVKPMPEKFSAILRKLREERGLSQTDLATKTRLQPSAISHFETDRRSPSYDNLGRLADALNVTVDYLTGRSAMPTPSGPIAERVLSSFIRLSTADQEALAAMAEALAAKPREAK
jgi:transcriptional regulator with XRE-family HTH domain